MNKKIWGIPISIIIAYILVYLFSFAWTAIFAAIPLLKLKPKHAFISGFLIGLIVPVSFYMLYPLGLVSELAGIIGNIVGLNKIIIVFVFPIMYAVIMALSATVFSGIATRPKKA
ncbi:MAG: hypothetical protein ACP5NL_06435 [Thermoplasmata archaeon]